MLRTRYRFDKRTLALSLPVLVVMTYFLTYVHESGHFSYCLSTGSLPSMKIDWLAGRTYCQVEQSNHEFNAFWYSFSGGFVACMVALLPMALTRRLIGYIPKWLLIPCLSLSGAQLGNAFIEAFLTSFYLTHPDIVILVLAIPTLGILFGGLFIFTRRHAKSADAPVPTVTSSRQLTLDDYSASTAQTKIGIEVIRLMGSKTQAEKRKADKAHPYRHVTMAEQHFEKAKQDPLVRWQRRVELIRLIRDFLLGDRVAGTHVGFEPTPKKHVYNEYDPISRLNKLCWGAD